MAHQSRPGLCREKKARDDLIDEAATTPGWVLGFQDECWWSRLAQPDVSSWTDGEAMRLHQPPRDKDDPEALAVACYGILRRDTGGMLLRFVAGRPVSGVTVEFLGWACAELAREGKTVLALVWDNAPWHVSRRVQEWIVGHNARVAMSGGCQLVVCGLPVKAPWLNAIEPKWVHGKRAVCEAGRKLSTVELKQRIHEYYNSKASPDLQQAA